MLPSVSFLPPIIPWARQWKNDLCHLLLQLLAPASHRLGTQAEEVVKLQNQALAFHHLLVPDRQGHCRKIREPDLQPRAEPTPLPIDCRSGEGLWMLRFTLCLRHLLLLPARVETVHH